MKTSRIEEMVEELEDSIVRDFQENKLALRHAEREQRFRKALTEAHQAGYADGYKQGKYEQKN